MLSSPLILQIFTFFRMFSRVYFQIFLKKMCFKILQRLKWNVWWYQWSNDNVLKIDLGKNALYISQKFHAHQILKTLFVKKSSLIPCGLISSIDCALLHAETKNTRENNGQFKYNSCSPTLWHEKMASYDSTSRSGWDRMRHDRKV